MLSLFVYTSIFHLYQLFVRFNTLQGLATALSALAFNKNITLNLITQKVFILNPSANNFSICLHKISFQHSHKQTKIAQINFYSPFQRI